MSHFGDDLKILTEYQHRRRECFSVLCPIGICVWMCCLSKYFWQPDSPECYLRPHEKKMLNSLCPKCEKGSVKLVYLNSRFKRTKKFICFKCKTVYSSHVHSLKISNEWKNRTKKIKINISFFLTELVVLYLLAS